MNGEATLKYEINHTTLYRYETPVLHSHQRLHLTPRDVGHQEIARHTLEIEPTPTMRRDDVDSFGNPVVMIEIDREHRTFSVRATSIIEVTVRAMPDPMATSPWEEVAASLSGCAAGGCDIDVIQYACPSRLTPASLETLEFAAQSFTPGRPVLEGARDLTHRIFSQFKFDATATDVSTPVLQVLRMRRGVCQDFSHLALACLRSLKLPARYVSGYLLTRPPPGHPKLRGADASHAWISVWAPETGWVDFDPTNGIIPLDEHIAIAYGRDYDDINPISGIILGGADHTVSVSVDVDPV